MVIIGGPAESAPVVRDEAIIFELLNTGEVDLSEGVARELSKKESITQIRRIGLFKGKHRIRAAFRDKSYRSHQVAITRSKIRYNDAYYNELAAYLISRYLGLNIIPPTVSRSLKISKTGLTASEELLPGTLQLWVENSMVLFDLKKEGIPYPGSLADKNSQIKEIKAFDCIIGNVDRHEGNILVDLNKRFDSAMRQSNEVQVYLGKLWAIDHSRSFYKGPMRSSICRLSKLAEGAVSRQFIQGMRNWDINEVKELLRSSGLSDKQVQSLHLDSVEGRFQKVKNHIENEQRKSGKPDSEFYSSGRWHQVK
ncbi:hypothetical protein [Thalassotalea mangrovi]|uniref:PI3K/PI4K catalytic domain-containing protein n=1 Tax=Thalassotalea mangrovi TaxID=2572245 RepID=A0A4V5NUN2_9GAMM|nr:hypothetical protein [Thalassotalea mangrovi]TKB47161.1 hypothetical protein E8M12_02560 [Thalassotalea mangrovi]